MPSVTYGFNGNPSSVVAGSGSYTIPANKFGYVTVSCKTAESFSVDGTTVLDTGGTVTAVATGSNGTTSAESYTVPSGYVFRGQVAWDSTTGGGLDTTVGTYVIGRPTTANGQVTVSAGPGQTITIQSGGSGAKTITGFIEKLPAGPVSGSYWLPAGTVLGGTGTYLVQLFTA
jgi:hypothetical protein